MNWRGKLEIGLAIGLVAILCFAIVQGNRMRRIVAERDRFRNNTETLLSEVERYQTRDSLNAARVQSLELTVAEFKRFRAEDAALIQTLKLRNRDLSAVNKTQAETIIELSAIPRDTIIIRDSIPIPAVSVHCGDEWYDFDGLLSAGEFTGTLANRDTLVLAESVRYRRFLGFLWKTKKVRDRQMDVVSKNPHTTILGIEHIVVEK